MFCRHSENQNCDTECLTDFYQPCIEKSSIFSLLYFLYASGLRKMNILRADNINYCCDLLKAALIC